MVGIFFLLKYLFGLSPAVLPYCQHVDGVWITCDWNKVVSLSKFTCLPSYLIHKKLPQVLDTIKLIGNTKSPGKIS